MCEPGDHHLPHPPDSGTARAASGDPLAASLRLFLALGMPVADMVLAFLGQGAEPLATLAAGAAFWPDPVSRFRWLRAWLTPATLDRSGLRDRDWAAVLAAWDIHPWSLPFSARTEEELAGYARLGPTCNLPGRLELVSSIYAFAIIGHPGAALSYRGDGGEFHLPEGLVIDSALQLEDWQVPGGWPRRLRSTGPLALERCAGRLDFPPGFRVDRGFLASHCSGLGRPPGGPATFLKFLDCDVRAIPPREHLQELSLVSCRDLAALGELPDLERLNLYRCPALKVVPALPKLRSLRLGGVPRLPGFQAGPALETIHLWGLERLRSLPADYAAAPNLSLDGLERLGSLASLRRPLESLSIRDCPALASLPADLRACRLSLARTGLRSLPPDVQAAELKIEQCPGLGIP